MKKQHYNYIFKRLFIFFWGVNGVLGQATPNNPYTPSRVTSPSANASSLGKYGEIPVSYYTGLPSTTIPIYTITEGDLSVPISASYHHSGIKVQEEASNIGLGWALNAGGVITRSVRRMDDLDERYGFPFNSYTTDPEFDTNFYTKYNEGNVLDMDSEPDIFTYNVGGKSGKFILLSGTNSSFPLTAKMLDYSDVQIKVDKLISTNPNYPNFIWTMTLTDGTIYTFTEYEKTKGGSTFLPLNYTDSDLGISVSTHPQLVEKNATYPALDYNATKGTMSSSITAWYLTSIKSVTSNNEIKFIYDVNNLYFSTSRITSSERVVFGGPLDTSQPFCVGTSIYGNGTGVTYMAQVSSNLYLKKIMFPKGEIEFTLADREDIQEYVPVNQFPNLPPGVLGFLYNRDSNTLPTKKPQRIQKITLRSGTDIKQWVMEQSYFNSSIVSPLTTNSTYLQTAKYYNNLRLRLDAIVEKNAAGTETLYRHKFTYNGDVLDNYGNLVIPVILPAKTSQATDYWGYYNGKDDNDDVRHHHIIPKIVYPKVTWAYNSVLNKFVPSLKGIKNTFDDYTGIDKEIDGISMQKGTLSQIIYPTGGNTKFIYEAHNAKLGTGELEYNKYTAENGSSSSFNVSINDIGKYYANIDFKLNCNGIWYCNGVGSIPSRQGNCTNFINTDPRLNQWYGKILVGSNDFRTRTFTDWQNKLCPSNIPFDICPANGLTGGGLSCNSLNSERHVTLGTPGLYSVSSAQMNPNNGQSPSSSVSMEVYRLRDDDYRYADVGGLRIAKIVNSDLNGTELYTKKFSYTMPDNTSSGILMKAPQRFSYGYTEIMGKERLSDPTAFIPSCPNPLWYTEIFSHSNKSEGSSASGQIVAYSRVVVSEGKTNTPNGYVTYEYENQKDIVADKNAYYDVPSTPNLSNGMIKTERTYSSSNQIIKESLFENTNSQWTNAYYGFMYSNIVDYRANYPLPYYQNPNNNLYAITILCNHLSGNRAEII